MTMRSPQEQEEYLEHGRFGDGKPNLTCARVSPMVVVGLLFVAAGGALMPVAALLGIGRDDGGPFFVMGAIVSGTIGVALCLLGLVTKRTR
jgi:hypothetical protein